MQGECAFLLFCQGAFPTVGLFASPLYSLLVAFHYSRDWRGYDIGNLFNEMSTDNQVSYCYCFLLFSLDILNSNNHA
jgi:hypothetical protein